jgi:hypothetical protein
MNHVAHTRFSHIKVFLVGAVLGAIFGGIVLGAVIHAVLFAALAVVVVAMLVRGRHLLLDRSHDDRHLSA